MNNNIRINAELSDDTFRGLENLARELSISVSDLAGLLIEICLDQKKLSNIEKNMIKGYALMGKINMDMANEAITSDGEAVSQYEEYLSGV